MHKVSFAPDLLSQGSVGSSFWNLTQFAAARGLQTMRGALPLSLIVFSVQ
jgi:hypothetical protein